MQTIEIGDGVALVDVEATKRSYESMKLPGPEECGCSYCRNWIQQRDASYPKKVRNLLREMGIPFGFETEICDAPDEAGRRLIWGWYLFIGTILASNNETPVNCEGMELSLSPFSSYDVEGFPREKCSQLNFLTRIDWILDEPAD